jgi:hypothetical protein
VFGREDTGIDVDAPFDIPGLTGVSRYAGGES